MKVFIGIITIALPSWANAQADPTTLGEYRQRDQQHAQRVAQVCRGIQLSAKMRDHEFQDYVEKQDRLYEYFNRIHLDAEMIREAWQQVLGGLTPEEKGRLEKVKEDEKELRDLEGFFENFSEWGGLPSLVYHSASQPLLNLMRREAMPGQDLRLPREPSDDMFLEFVKTSGYVERGVDFQFSGTALDFIEVQRIPGDHEIYSKLVEKLVAQIHKTGEVPGETPGEFVSRFQFSPGGRSVLDPKGSVVQLVSASGVYFFLDLRDPTEILVSTLDYPYFDKDLDLVPEDLAFSLPMEADSLTLRDTEYYVKAAGETDEYPTDHLFVTPETATRAIEKHKRCIEAFTSGGEMDSRIVSVAQARMRKQRRDLAEMNWKDVLAVYLETRESPPAKTKGTKAPRAIRGWEKIKKYKNQYKSGKGG